MAEPGEDLSRVPNRQTLRRLANGMEITRATKHEPIDFESLDASQLMIRTDARHGSKFLAEWNLPRLAEWLEEQVATLGWRFPPGVPVNTKVRVRFGEPVGYVAGRLVRTITITASGRWVHAYPDKD